MNLFGMILAPNHFTPKMRSLLLFVSFALYALADLPYVQYWHNWASDDGETHLTLCNITSNWVSHSFGPGQVPIFTDTLPFPTTLTWFYTPALWDPAEFHANPVVQFGVWFTGAMRFEATDGTIVEVVPGMVYLGDDVGSKGHHSQNTANVVALSAMIQFSGPTGKGPCWIK
eukprot:TRINITY_DN7637_c0_g1_i1.p1 TRINITY_DN7637_c0_g1~~TRINITY_DN7637_c0_g1_i1.p1  ORF type:complete len:172 (-),score=11.07 TRINITY_DN7637_c0_g1_i1:17-532(-)